MTIVSIGSGSEQQFLRNLEREFLWGMGSVHVYVPYWKTTLLEIIGDTTASCSFLGTDMPVMLITRGNTADILWLSPRDIEEIERGREKEMRKLLEREYTSEIVALQDTAQFPDSSIQWEHRKTIWAHRVEANWETITKIDEEELLIAAIELRKQMAKN